MAHSRVGKRGSHADRPPIPPTIYKRTRSSSFNVAASSQSTGNGKDTPPTANTRTRSGSSNVATNSTTTNNSTTSGINNTTFIIKDTTTAPNKRQRRAKNKRSNSIVSNGSSKNTSASSAKKQNNSKQMETSGAQAPTGNEDIESDDPDNSGDEFVDAGSGSEAEELEDFNDEDEDDDGTQESAPNTSGAPQARLINNRGLKKTVDYVWLIGKLVNTAMDLNRGKEKAQRKGKGKDEAISIAEQELEFVRQVDESSHGHAGNTQAAYKSTYRPYMEFCDKVYAEEGLKRYEVNAVKTARFLKEKLFPQSTRKNIPTHIIKDTKVFMHRSVIQNHGIPITGEGIQGTFDFALYLKEIEKKRPKKAAEQNKEGPLKPTQVMVPYGVSRISQAYSAIIHLWTLQTSRLRQRSEEPAIRPSKLIEKTIDAYKRSLVGGILKAEHFEKDADGNIIKVGREVTTDSYATNYYSIQEHIKCLLYTWQQPVTARSSGMREHFNLAVRHAMLLRDEDLRRLNIANCTIDTLEQQLGGTQPIMAMVFSIHGGKTSQHGLRQEGIAIRHHDVRRCSVGAMAFYLYERFQVRGEPWPNMIQDAGWTGIKLLSSGAGSDKYAEISYSTNRATTMDVFIANNISCSNITHSGRHSGAKEGVRLNVLEEDIRTGGRWIQNTGKMQQYYLQKRPTQWALAIAGFRNKPFHLPRNEVDPPLDLQRQIFPFIESLIGNDGTKKNTEWKRDCDREMEQFDPNNTAELETVLPEPLTPLSKSDGSRRPTVYRVRSNITFVLRLMLRLRRVLLQDAAVYLFLGKTQGFRSPLLDTPNSVFMSKAFLSFQEDVVAAVLMKKVVLPKNIPDNMLRALEVSSSNQSNDMHVLRKSLTAVNDKLAHQSNQSLWANNILDALAKSFLAQEQQLRIQRETIESMQQAIDAMARQLRLQGPVAPGNPGNLSYSRQSGIPSPGYLGYTGISTPAPGFLPHFGPFPGHQSPMPKQKQSKLVQNRSLVAIQPSHSGSSSQDSSIVLPTRPSSELERLLSTRPQGMPVLESHQPESASGSGPLTEAGISASVQRPSAPPRETWFTWTTHHSSTKSIFEEYQRYKSELATRLEPGDGGKHRLKQKRRQSDATEKHVSDIRIISTEVDILKDKVEQEKGGSISAEQALSHAFEEMDTLVKFNSNKNIFSFAQARTFCGKTAKEREDERKSNQ